ncbi:MAG: DNA replication and repair protein RecF [Ignavibacteriaceae bacterium]
MVLTNISLRNFRIHRDINVRFSKNLNYIVGGNGQGKTTILDSIYYLCTTKSHYTKTDSESVSFNEEEFEVSGNFKDLSESKNRIIYSLVDNKKKYFQDNKKITRSVDIIGRFPVVILTPADHSITQGYPGDRRRFVDSVISQASNTYLKVLLDYNKTLRQRSSLLGQIKESRKTSLLDELNAWTAKLIQAGTEIIKHRKKFVAEFNGFIKNSYCVIMGSDEIPKATYSFFDNAETEEIEEKFSNLLNKKREEEIRRATNLIGPHRDDFVFEINGLNLKTFGSQGQHKTFQVVLRFAQFFYLKKITGKTPIFLLDDVFGELDKNRSAKISEYLREVGQAFITLTDFANLSFLKKEKSDLLLQLNNGQISYA